MSKSRAAVVTATLLLILPAWALAAQPRYSLHVDIRELARWRAKENVVLAALLKIIHANPDKFVNDSIKRVESTASRRRLSKPVLQLFGIERVEEPRIIEEAVPAQPAPLPDALPPGEQTHSPDDGQTKPAPESDPDRLVSRRKLETLRAFYQNKKGDWIYKTLEITYPVGKLPTKLEDLEIRESSKYPAVAAEQTRFQVRSGIEERRLIIEDSKNHIRKIFPIGPGNKGGNPDGRSASMYLAGESCTIGGDDSLLSSYDYKASACRVLKDGKHTRYLCHGPVSKTLIRGWVSKGCMRMQPKDSNELFQMLEASGRDAPIAILGRLKDAEDLKYDHPYPLSNISSMTKKNLGPARGASFD